MDTAPVQCLINSISRLLHLVSCQTIKSTHVQRDYIAMAFVLKVLKPVLDDIVDRKVPSDVVIYKECEALDLSVNEAREFLENWSLKMSKIRCVLQTELLLMKIQNSTLDIFRMLVRLLQMSSSALSVSGLRLCMQEIENLKHEWITGLIQDSMRSREDDIVPSTDHLLKIIQFFGFTSNQELLKESLAIEKERNTAQFNESKGELAYTNQIADLISRIRDCILSMEHFESTSGVLVPPYFRCPLSMELMLDPVIVASGQTYDKASIQKWLDHGLAICPKTRKMLEHTNLTPNFTVKAMIANWCTGNNISLPTNFERDDMKLVPSSGKLASSQNLTHTDSFLRSSSSSTSRSVLKMGKGLEKISIDVTSRLSGESNCTPSNGTQKYDCFSLEQSYTHSRSESASSIVSSVDYGPSVWNEASKVSKHQHMDALSADISSDCSQMKKCLLGNQILDLEPKPEALGNGNHESSRLTVPPFSDSNFNDLTTTSHVKKLVEDLESTSNVVQTAAAMELRLLAKHNMENRDIIVHCGAIGPLLSLLYSDVKQTQEHATTALLNLSINKVNKAMIAEAGAIEPLVYVLETGNDGAKENAAVTLFSLSNLEEYKPKIGRSGAIKGLVSLLKSGTLRGKKDAATALFNLSIFHENKARIVQAGAVKYLVNLMDPASEMVDKAVALLANLSTVREGRLPIAREGGIPLLVEIVDSGSQRGKENAASILVQLCINSSKLCTLVLQEGAVPPLVSLSQSGSPRAKEKAQQLLSHFRTQRQGMIGKGRG